MQPRPIVETVSGAAVPNVRVPRSVWCVWLSLMGTVNSATATAPSHRTVGSFGERTYGSADSVADRLDVRGRRPAARADQVDAELVQRPRVLRQVARRSVVLEVVSDDLREAGVRLRDQQ